MKGFNYYQDRSNEWRWRLLDGNNKIVADSAEGYRDKADCSKGASLFQTLGPTAPERKAEKNDTKGQGPEWEYYEDNDQQWRWRFQAGNNKVIADSAEGYVSEYNVKRAIANVKDLLQELSKAGGGSGGGYTPPAVGGSSGPGRFA
ncbi:YegP family protein [Hymenobacter sp. NST-14]|uniref:YegP family protein n=1 Tax=Hymenobacter piscis TaxID=2839984 RepID=UPI001C0108E5|nr:YegP family protein [Hymenobacter piscis]MBT9391778.1 YegP family protein [Hymenobacter piscis]